VLYKDAVNRSHLEYLASPAWADALRGDLLPWLESSAELGDDVLEIGPGPGLTTDLLRVLTARLTAAEIDPTLAAPLRERLNGTNVEVLEGDALTLDLGADRFSAVTCLSMLHHMPSAWAQDELFARIHQVLRPGAHLLAVDSIDSEPIRQGHVDDTFVPLDPKTLPGRLMAVGFTDVSVQPSGAYQFRFTATKTPDTAVGPPADAKQTG
jgi:SAM-dependent methyltransferase